MSKPMRKSKVSAASIAIGLLSGVACSGGNGASSRQSPSDAATGADSATGAGAATGADAGTESDSVAASTDAPASGRPDAGTDASGGTADGSPNLSGPYCARNSAAVFCDDFSDANKTNAQWTKDVNGTTNQVTVGTAMTYKGAPTLQVQVDGSGGVAMLQAKLPSSLVTLYGRMRMRVTPIGGASGFPKDNTSLFSASSGTAGSYALGEQFQLLSTGSSPEIGGVHFEYPGCAGQSGCVGQPWPTGTWMCIEWEYTDKYTDIYNNGRAGTSQSVWLYMDSQMPPKSVLLADQYGSETPFPLFPSGFDSIQLGAALHGDDHTQAPSFEFYFADFAIGASRFNDCASDE